MIFDTHAHYDDDAFAKDREELLSGLQAGGIETVVNISASIQGTKNTLELIEKYPFFYGAVGVHPSETEELSETVIAWLKEMAGKPKVVYTSAAAGEGREAAGGDPQP